MSDYKKAQRPRRRAAILQFLAASQAYAANSEIILDVVRNVGIPTYHPELLKELNWLEEKGYVELNEEHANVLATATRRGIRIAKGDAVDPGIDRPEPGL